MGVVQMVDITYRRLCVDFISRQVSTKVRVVELFPVAETSAEKGQFAPYEAVSNSGCYLPDPPEGVEWTLVWSKYRNNTISTKGNTSCDFQ